MDKTTTENILIDYISHDVFKKNMRLDHSSGIATTVEYMILDIRNIHCHIEEIKIGKSNLPTLDNRFFAYIKIRGVEKAIMSHFYPMFNVSNFVAEHIGRNLIWVDIYTTNKQIK
jgi:hypothetical protein